MNNLLSYQHDNGVATITLDDGKVNAMSVGMLAQFASAIDQAEKDKAILLIQGRPGMFSGGFDLTAFKRDKQELFDMLKAGAELTERLLSFPYPVMGVCTGHAIAMGVFILLSADVRIGVMPSGKLQVNEVQIGLTLPRFAIEVCRQCLAPATLSLATITSKLYTQQDGVANGFLDELALPEAAQETVKQNIEHLRGLNMPAFTATKLRLREAALANLRAAIEADCADWKARFFP